MRFADFEFDPRTGQLRRGDTLVKLQQQPARVLALLVSRPGEVVTRQELAREVWGSETFVDFEQGLNFAIRHIRAAFGDDAEQPRFLQTLPKRGYRFIATVESSPNEPSVAALPAANLISGNDSPAAKARLPRVWAVIAAISIVLLVAAAITYVSTRGRADRTPRGGIQSIAVLPLVNLSADPAQEYFSDGLTDELITELAKIGTLRVISRTSVSAYKGTHKTTPAIASELHVDAVVEGTIERGGNHLRIRAQLIQAATDQHLWAESYDGDVTNMLELDSNVARDIATQIGHLAARNDDVAARPTVAVAAHEDYLRGRYYWNKRTEAGLRKGIEYFQKAIDQEPNYALAYAGLADSHIMLANWGFAPPADSYRKAKDASLKALELDPQLAEAHTSLAYVTLLYEWNWPEAERRFRQAIAINPNYASAHHFYSICLMTAGRQAEALTEIQRAQELDPLSLIVGDVYGWIYYEGRQYDRAIEQYKKTLEMDPSYVPALLDLGTSYLRTGDYSQAVKQFKRAEALEGDKSTVLSSLAQGYAFSGQRTEARKILDQIQQPAQQRYVSPWDISLVYAALGEHNHAIELLGKAADDHVGWVVRLGVDPSLDDLRRYAEFQNLARRIGIPEIRLPKANS